MDKKIRIHTDYLYLPVQAEKEKQLLEIYLEMEGGESRKLTEFFVPVGKTADSGYPCDYFARFPVKQFTDKTLTLKGNFPEAFWESILTDETPAKKPTERPSIHFAAENGWLNDPNGLIFQDGTYHLYFQYNPFDTKWDNMCWGHAVSMDLLHWQQKDTVLFPDEHGTMFSGSGIRNKRECLNLPAEALLFFYTAAGGSSPMNKEAPFTQRLAYSVDNGESLVKTDLGVLQTDYRDSRDPKVFWHGESNAYIMVLWLEKNDFGIFRSDGLETWKQSDILTLDGAWECPDLIRLANGGTAQWLFWSADGYYYWGSFDGYQFQTDGIRHQAYMNEIPYAAQTYSGIRDRVISVPWLRLPNQGRQYTGVMGIPRELSIRKQNGKKMLVQNLIREFHEQKIEVDCSKYMQAGHLSYHIERAQVIELLIRLKDETAGIMCWNIRGTMVSYQVESGVFQVGTQELQLEKGIKDFEFVIDDNIFEVTVNYGTITGAFPLAQDNSDIIAECNIDIIEEVQLFTIVS